MAYFALSPHMVSGWSRPQVETYLGLVRDRLASLTSNPVLVTKKAAELRDLQSSEAALADRLRAIQFAEYQVVKATEAARQTSITEASTVDVEKFRCPRGTTLVNRSTAYGVVPMCRSPWGHEIPAGDPEAQQIPLKVQVVDGVSGVLDTTLREVLWLAAGAALVGAAFFNRGVRRFVIPLVAANWMLRYSFQGILATTAQREKINEAVNVSSLYIAATVWVALNFTGWLCRSEKGRKWL